VSFRIREGRDAVYISCARCNHVVGRYQPDEIMQHAFSGKQYHCEACDGPLCRCGQPLTRGGWCVQCGQVRA
jgi:hypothetical protein